MIDVGMNKVTDAAEFERLFAGNAKREESFRTKRSTLVGDVHPNRRRKLRERSRPSPAEWDRLRLRCSWQIRSRRQRCGEAHVCPRWLRSTPAVLKARFDRRHRCGQVGCGQDVLRSWEPKLSKPTRFLVNSCDREKRFMTKWYEPSAPGFSTRMAQ